MPMTCDELLNVILDRIVDVTEDVLSDEDFGAYAVSSVTLLDGADYEIEVRLARR